jgi:4-aminobutyrate aminotransferase/diaminobutyrate-pyruvate transaminase/4-aminobutyrate aminotransferase/(S)-3-amino-2-methylpropionate transaminase
MAGYSYSLVPRSVPRVETSFRRIVTKIPVPESLPILKALREYEPVAMTGQPPVVWDRAEGFQVYDKWGNMWLDWSSGVLVANCGHGREEMRRAIVGQVEHGLLHNYCFPSEIRSKLVENLVRLAPKGLDKVFLLTTGSETTENAIKLARTYGRKIDPRKTGVISFSNAFHGRTLGAQMIGGIPALKEWIGEFPPGFYQVPFPDGFRCEDQSFGLFLKALSDLGIDGSRVCCVLMETYIGGGASFAPKEYVQQLAEWCRRNRVVLVFDEVQAGFGRTGKFFGFEHYGVTPDLICCGKGITSSLPLSAVIGRRELMDQYGPGEMTSTHTGNPVCVAAALSSIELIEREGLVENARRVGEILHGELGRLKERYSAVGVIHGKGLVAGLHIVKEGGKEPDKGMAFRVVERCMEKGLLFFSPVGVGGGTIKVCPPLNITDEAALDGVGALEEAMGECT